MIIHIIRGRRVLINEEQTKYDYIEPALREAGWGSITKIKDIPQNERPREKLLEKGAKYLSDEDLAVTERLKAVGKILGIQVLDHLIFNQKGVFSIFGDK